MCGIAGELSLDPSRRVDDASLRAMLHTLRHRGPDDEGIWVDGRVGLGSRRLAVIDLSPRAGQPLANEDGALHIVFNGEIYNFRALRDMLQRKGHSFRSASDTETIVHLYEEEGVNCLAHLRGMFALALWDQKTGTLFLARDRLGKKPLFYYRDRELFLFASEPKAILQHPSVRAEPDVESLHYFLTYGYVPAPQSAFRGIRKLPPAHYLIVRNGQADLHRYWSLRYTEKRTESEHELGEELDAILEDAVRLRLVSDVPLGALLSGGLDSSTVVALMRRLTSGPVRTFSIGFDRPDYDELPYAREVARRFETDHHELVVKPDAVKMLPRLVWHYNEPFADSSAVPAFALAEMARDFVTVALNGDGGDEALIGYDRYVAMRLAEPLDVLPNVVRRAVARVGRTLPAGSPKGTMARLRRFTEALPLDPRRRYGRWLTLLEGDEMRRLYTSEFAARVEGLDQLAPLAAAYAASGASSLLEATVHADVQLYLPDDLLVKMDIASMAHSLEVRSPFLDHRVLEFTASLPVSLKLRGLTPKYLLRRIMKNVLPSAILRRHKMGFGVPIDSWFRHELREMAYDVLLDSRSRQRDYFRPDMVRQWLDEHVRGRVRRHSQLWALLMFELWHRMFIDQRCPSDPPQCF